MTPRLPSLTSAAEQAELVELPVRNSYGHNDSRPTTSVLSSSQTPTTNKKLFALVAVFGLASVVWMVVDAGMRYGFSNPWVWQL